MPVIVYYDNKLEGLTYAPDVNSLKDCIEDRYGVNAKDLYATYNGKKLDGETNLSSLFHCYEKSADEAEINSLISSDSLPVIRICTRLVGGKGGFGSMLRAIGAQIEKTTNREACRDLSGRRLRDINEEKRLRKWLEGQEERDNEAADRKRKKLEKLLEEPKISVNLAPSYEKEREALPERVSAAVDAGWQAAGSSDTANKRKTEDVKKDKGKKKAKLWIDADLSECSSSSDEETSKPSAAKAVSTDSGNESDRTSASSSKA